RLQILHADDNGGGMAVLGDHYPAVLAFQPVHDLREPVLDLCQRHLLTHRHSHKYSYFRRMGTYPSSGRACHLRLGPSDIEDAGRHSPPADAELSVAAAPSPFTAAPNHAA